MGKILLFKENRLETEEQLLFDHANILGLGVDFATMKEIGRGKFDVTRYDVVAGPIMFIKHSLRLLGKELPVHTPYPDSLSPWFHRKVRYEKRLGDVLNEVESGKSLFIKPARGWKRFTGFVCDDPRDYRFRGCSLRMPVWVSDPVVFNSEWRVYVVNKEILGIYPTPHTNSIEMPDIRDIEGALKVFLNGPHPSGFVIDFGVLSTGQTALVEVNDGFSVGAYGIDAQSYFKLISVRWAELVA